MTTIYEKEKRQAFIKRNRWNSAPWKVAQRTNSKTKRVNVTGRRTRNSEPKWLG